MKPEEMRAFFTARVDGYDAHMRGHVKGAAEKNAGFAGRDRLLRESGFQVVKKEFEMGNTVILVAKK